MSTLEEAKSAIESAIAQIEARLALLKISLEHLDAAIRQPDVRRQTVVSGHGAKPIKAAPASSTRTAKNHKPLPKTGESFWLQFMSQEPQLSGDLFSPALVDSQSDSFTVSG